MFDRIVLRSAHAACNLGMTHEFQSTSSGNEVNYMPLKLRMNEGLCCHLPVEITHQPEDTSPELIMSTFLMNKITYFLHLLLSIRYNKY